jgi:hypothetical protein
MARGLELYRSEYCHLCEDAKVVMSQAGVVATAIDIGDSDALIERYGSRIPVLRRVDTGAELAWPFEIERLRCFLI